MATRQALLITATAAERGPVRWHSHFTIKTSGEVAKESADLKARLAAGLDDAKRRKASLNDTGTPSC